MEKLTLLSCVCVLLFAVPALGNNDLVNFQELLQQSLENSCMNVTGDREVYLHVKDELDNYNECAAEVIDPLVMQRDLMRGARRGELNKVFNKYCNKFDEFFTCFSGFSDAYDQCLTDIEKIDKEKALGTARKLINYICSDHGNLLAQFFINGGPICIETNKIELTECLQAAAPDPNTYNMTVGMNDKIMCPMLEKIDTCTGPVLQNCNTANAYDFMKGVVNVFEEDLLCQHYLETNQIGPNVIFH